MSKPGEIAVNRRAASGMLSGVQRYVLELTRRLTDMVELQPVKPLNGVRGHLWEQFRLPSLLHADLLWSPANSGPVAVERQVVTVHDLAVLDHPEWFNRRFAIWYRWMVPRLVRRVRRIIAVSEFTKQRLVELTGVAEARVVVVPNGVDQRFYPREAKEINQIRNKLAIPAKDYILSIATIEPRKNLKRQLEAWSRCLGQVPESVWLIIAGVKGQSRIFQNAEIGTLPPRVIMSGFIPEASLPALYSGASALLYASIYEGFGLPALEAMACGTVPIVSKGTAMSEVVGDYGILINPLEVDSIASGISRSITDLSIRDRLSHAGRERSKTFSWERSAELTYKALADAI